jgi:hyperosmotically inducible periplasmic protein
MKKAILMSMLALLTIGCERQDKKENALPKDSNVDAAKNADGTGKNAQDKEGQLEDEMDRTITRNVRQALMGEDGLSKNAKNVKIITTGRIVTLRGPVPTAHEKEIIERKASQIKGVERIDNFIEVTNRNQ